MKPNKNYKKPHKSVTNPKKHRGWTEESTGKQKRDSEEDSMKKRKQKGRDEW